MCESDLLSKAQENSPREFCPCLRPVCFPVFSEAIRHLAAQALRW